MSFEPTAASTALIAYITDELLRDDTSRGIGPDDDLLSGGRIDSLGVMRLVEFVESRFGVQVPLTDITIENFISVRTLVTYLATLEPSDAGAGKP